MYWNKIYLWNLKRKLTNTIAQVLNRHIVMTETEHRRGYEKDSDTFVYPTS